MPSQKHATATEFGCRAGSHANKPSCVRALWHSGTSAVGFKPTSCRTGAWSQRLPLSCDLLLPMAAMWAAPSFKKHATIQEPGSRSNSKKMTPAGLEPAIPGSVGRCLIHWATGPINNGEMLRNSPNRFGSKRNLSAHGDCVAP